MSDAEDQDHVPAAADDDGAANVTLAKLTVPQIEQTVEALSTAISREALPRPARAGEGDPPPGRGSGDRVDQASRPGRVRPHHLQRRAPEEGHLQGRCPLLNMLLEACGGDVNELCRLLRSDPFRYGECAKVLGDARWNDVFHVDWSDKLVLKSIESRFLPKPRGDDAAP